MLSIRHFWIQYMYTILRAELILAYLFEGSRQVIAYAEKSQKKFKLRRDSKSKPCYQRLVGRYYQLSCEVTCWERGMRYGSWMNEYKVTRRNDDCDAQWWQFLMILAFFFLRTWVMKSSRPLFVFLFILLLCNLIMTINSESNKPFRFHSRRWILRRNKQKKPDTKSNGKRYVGSLSEDLRMETTTRDSPNVSELKDAVFIWRKT